MLSAFRRKPPLDRAPTAPTASGPGPAALPDPPPAAATPAIDGAIVDMLEADVLKAIGAVTEAIGSATGQVTGTRAELDRIRGSMGELVAAGQGATAQTVALAASTEELAATSGEINGAMTQAQGRIGQAVETASGANALIAELARATEEIVGIIDTISAVARQTNLLALNATIEAARAGAAGRGFAVVAGEVKALSVETATAANDIRARVTRLRDSATASIMAVEEVVGVIRDVEPVFATVRGAVDEQNAAIGELAQRAAEASAFVEQVSSLAHTVEGAAETATARIGQANQASGAAESLARALAHRFVAVMRQSEIGDRRRFDRFPKDLRVSLKAPQGAAITRTVDISRGGLLLAPTDGLALPAGAPVTLDAEGLGAVRARVVATSPMGLHCAFADLGADEAARVEGLVHAVAAEYKPLIDRAQDAAERVTVALEEAVAAGRLDPDSLFDADYRPVPGTAPQQYETRFLSLFEDLLPAIQEPLLASDPRMVFCLAIDRNGYIPVHNTVYSKPQRPGDVAWNTANSRNRRIFDDRAGITAARSVRPFVVQAYARDMGGTVVLMREVDAPIRLFGRHWGGFRTAYRL